MSKITFKRQKKETGLAGVARPYASVDLKYKKKVFGYISPPSYTSTGWMVRICVCDPLSSSGFTWMSFKKVFDTEDEARQFVINKTEKILSYNLHFEDDD